MSENIGGQLTSLVKLLRLQKDSMVSFSVPTNSQYLEGRILQIDATLAEIDRLFGFDVNALRFKEGKPSIVA
jgi:hypothetical protein